MPLKKEAQINNTKLFNKLSNKERNHTQPGLVKTITHRKRIVKKMITEKFGKINLSRKPSAQKLLEEGMKDLFFGRKGIVTKRISKLEKELVQNEIRKKNKFENKIFIGSMPYLSIVDLTKDKVTYKNNEVIKRKLMKSNNFTLIPKKPIFTSVNQLRLKSKDNNRMNCTVTAIGSDEYIKSGLFPTGVDSLGNSNSKSYRYHKGGKGVINNTFYKLNTRKVIRDNDTTESIMTSQLKTTTSNSPITNMKKVNRIKPNNNIQPYIKTSMIDNYNKTLATVPNGSSEKNLLSNRIMTHPRRQKTSNANVMSAISQALQSRISNLDQTNNKVETKLISLIDSSNTQGPLGAINNKSLINQSQLQTDYETIFNRKCLTRRKTILTRETIKKKFDMAKLMIDPIKTTMNQLQSKIHKLTDKQAESIADEIASRYLKSRNDAIYKDEDVNYAEMVNRPQSKEMRDLKRRLSDRNNKIHRLRHTLIQEKVKLMYQYDVVNSKDNTSQNYLNETQRYGDNY